MNPLLVYFLKVNVALALFHVLYLLLFRQDTFFRLRRFALLSFFALAFLYPLVDVREWMSGQAPFAEVQAYYAAFLPDVVVYPAYAGASGEYGRLLPGLYLLGMTGLAVRFGVQLAGIARLASRSKREVVEGRKVYLLDIPSGPFSFFRFIFLGRGINRREEREEIITHEYIHASQWHSLDVIVAEWICIVCWMNPFVWLLRREVKLNLEYLADKGVLQSGFDSKAYQYLLVGLAGGYSQAAAHLYNNFNVLPLKNRISMMNKKRSSAIARTKYLICIPLTALLVLLGNMSACSSGAKTGEAETAEMAEITVTGKADAPVEPQPETATGSNREVFVIVENMPKFPGGDRELMEYLYKTIKYPEAAQEKGIQGRVVVQFIVNEDGSISDAVVTRGVDPLLDREALRVIGTMPKWTPGKQSGKVVAVKFTVPVIFKLEKNG